MSAPVLSDVKKVLFMRPRNCTTESNKLWNYRKTKESPRLRVYLLYLVVLPYVTVYAVTYRLWPSSSPSDSKLQQFFIFSPAFIFLIILFIFIFPYISFAFSSTSLPLFTHGQLDDSKLIYDFFIISIDGINTMYIGFVLTLYEIKCITKNMDHIGSHK